MKKVLLTGLVIFVLLSCSKKPVEAIGEVSSGTEVYEDGNAEYTGIGTDLLREALSLAGKKAPDSYYRDGPLKYYNTDLESELGDLSILINGYEFIELTTNIYGEAMFSTCCYVSDDQYKTHRWADGCLTYLEDQGFKRIMDGNLQQRHFYMKDGVCFDLTKATEGAGGVYVSTMVFFLDQFAEMYFGLL